MLLGTLLFYILVFISDWCICFDFLIWDAYIIELVVSTVSPCECPSSVFDVQVLHEYAFLIPII